MLKDDLKCVLVGRNVKIYYDLARLVRKIEPNSRFKQVDLNKASIVTTLKKISGPSLIFISDNVPFSLELLSDLIWQYNADSIVVIVTKKAKNVSIKELFNNTQFSRVNLGKNKSDSVPILQFLIQSAKEKADFRLCKSLLGISEKRCQWLVDSSREAIAFISRDIHWYANTAYLQLFGINSIQELRSITVKDVIVSDEHLLFEGFQQNQGKSADRRRSIMLSMKKSNGSTFRANVYLIPSVFKGQKCNQLWIREVNSLSKATSENQKIKTKEKSKPFSNNTKSQKAEPKEEKNPFSSLLRKDQESKDTKLTPNKIWSKESQKSKSKPHKQKTYDQQTLLKGVIRRKEARVIATPLKSLKENESHIGKTLIHQILSLKVAAAQKQGVDNLLDSLPESFNKQMRSIFWDKVKLSKILQALVKKQQLSVNLLIRINESSVVDEAFIDWLIPGLKRLGSKSKNLIFLIPSNISDSQYKKTLLFIKSLKRLGCRVALDSFSVNKKSLVLLKYSKPEYVRLSLPWTRQIHGNESKELQLSSIIRQLENKNIKVIASCDFSKDMRRLFMLSGASFCQERTIKTV